MPDERTIVLQGHVAQSDRDEAEYVLRPFEVGPGIGRLSVCYSVSQRISADQAGWQEGNIIDIGMFDPRGAEFLSGRGFRGWSGSMREQFTISPEEATPGYVPGPIYAGLWHIALGLYQIAPDGCDYRVEIALEPGEHLEAPRRDPRPVATQRGRRWYRGDLHAHTWHSDGTASVGDLVAAARAQGLDFVSVTEHNTVSHLPLLGQYATPDLLLLPGVEISTYHGHANVWPVDGFVEFRCSTDEQIAAVREAIRARGALFSINHPKEGGPPWEFSQFHGPDAVEVWGGPWSISNYQSLAVWDGLLRRGERVTAVGGSDKHVAPYAGNSAWYDVGTPCTWVYADELTVPAIVEGIRAGRAYVSATPEGPQLCLTAYQPSAPEIAVTMGDEVVVPLGGVLHLACRVLGASGDVLRLVSGAEVIEADITEDDFSREWEVTVERSTYWRAEVIEPPEAPLDEEPAALMALALGNPIYVQAT